MVSGRGRARGGPGGRRPRRRSGRRRRRRPRRRRTPSGSTSAPGAPRPRSAVGREDLVGDRDLGRVDAGAADEPEPGQRARRRPERVEVAEVRSRPARSAASMPAAARGEDDVRAGVEQLALVGAGRDAEVGAQVGLADLQPLHPRRPGDLAGARAPRAALSSSGTTRGRWSPATSSSSVERRRSSSTRLGLGDQKPVSAGAPATARTSASRSGAGVDPHPDPDVVEAPAGRAARSATGRRGPRPCRAAATASSRSTMSSSAPRLERLGELVGGVAGDVERGARQPGAQVNRHGLSLDQRLRDDGAQDVVGALADAHQDRVAVEPLDLELGGVAVAAVHLHRVDGGLQRRPRSRRSWPCPVAPSARPRRTASAAQ